ncbi:MAG: DUF4105 domain-containing protein [Cyclobacteriaceae bacterium]|nr:DUF4105 domain-containing protein [Cyclobacteriaceae bacterium]
MQRYFILIILLSHFSFGFTQTPLSEEAEISVITCGPDPNEVYSAFGHSAFRVRDPAQGIDYAFNYGVFNFDQPNFYLNFARGRNYYMLAVYHYEDFEWPYIRDQRYVHEQVLQLTSSQKEKIFSFLMWNAQPENRTYRYDYYHNNCATKIRDVLVEQLGSDLSMDSSFLQAEHSFRQKTDEYLHTLPWGDLGIDICLGLPIDRTMYANEYMFLPDYIESFVGNMSVKTDSTFVPLVKELRIKNEASVTAWYSLVHPWVAFMLLLIIITGISIHDWRRKKPSRWFDGILFSIVGLIGLLLLALWLFTDHHDAARNFNLLWAFPLHLVAVGFLITGRGNRILPTYFLVCSTLLGLTLLFWWALPQELNVFLIPVVAGLWVRCLLNWKVSTMTQS